jgi:hypothetical protein
MCMSETSKIASAQAHQRVPPHRVRHRRVLQQSVAWSLLIQKSPTSLRLDQHANPGLPLPMLRSEESE